MCTISWFFHDRGYELFFNRDESLERESAQTPKVFEKSLRFIMPIDPLGGGTWLAVNEYGLSCALLNFYQGQLPKGRLLSRGKIVAKLIECSSLAEIESQFCEFDLQRYTPFSLLVFCRQNGSDTRVPMFRWTGKHLERDEQASPLISSAFDFERVALARQKAFVGMKNYLSSTEIATGIGRHRNLHASHIPSASAYSICMHRSDAKTMSFSHVSVDGGLATFRYTDGPPCSSPLIDSAEINLI